AHSETSAGNKKTVSEAGPDHGRTGMTTTETTGAMTIAVAVAEEDLASEFHPSCR
ncbi:hypothetical protein AAVH_30209, partial [Aphelenchoides avenae]